LPSPHAAVRSGVTQGAQADRCRKHGRWWTSRPSSITATATAQYLDEGGGVGDVVADEALSGDADLILADGGGLGRRLLHPLVPIHGAFLRRRSRRPSGGGGGAAVVGGEVTEGGSCWCV
jgi:hypothetical protein